MAFLVVLLVGISTYTLQRSFIYFPTPIQPNPQSLLTAGLQPIKLPVTNKLTLNSWYKSPLPNKPVVMYLHGNAGTVRDRLYLTHQFISVGFGVLLLEYRGYGGNSGSPSERGLYQDGRAAMHFLSQQGIPEKKIVLYGESLGTGVATQLATEYPICALVLQSAYTSLIDLARYHYFWLPIPIWDKYDSLSRIRHIHAPILMLHGQLDRVVPYTQGLKLFKQANQPKQWHEFPNKGHNDLWDNNFALIITQFINQYCITD